MANLEAKILDGPKISYCDAGDDDKRHDDDTDVETETPSANASTATAASVDPRARDAPSHNRNRVKLEKIGRSETFNGCSVNTGPKGVIHDFKREVTRSDRPSIAESVDDVDVEFQHLMADDSILQEFKAKMMQKQSKKTSDSPTFGYVKHVQSGDEFLKNVDDENPNVLVISHVFRKFSSTCSQLNKCLEELASEFKSIKFICIDAAVVGLSNNFVENGVPALLAYKSGNLIKSMVSLEEHLDKNFDVIQLKELLAQNNVLL